MPELLSIVDPTAYPSFPGSGFYPLEQRPHLLPFAMRIVTGWADLEVELGMLLVSMLRSRGGPAVAMYNSLNGTASKRRAVEAAAKNALKADQLELLLALTTLYERIAKDRNRIAHWIWGSCSELPDAALLVDPAVLVDANVGMRTGFRAMANDGRDEDGTPVDLFASMKRVSSDQVWVYTSEDLEFTSVDIDRLSSHFSDFRFVLDGLDDRNGGMFPSLLAMPEADKIITRRRQRATSAKPQA